MTPSVVNWATIHDKIKRRQKGSKALLRQMINMLCTTFICMLTSDDVTLCKVSYVTLEA